MRLQIRPVEAADATALAYVHVRAWQTAYRGIVPDAFLNAMNLPAREAAWQERLQNAEIRAGTFAAVVDNAIVGFASGGAERDGVVAWLAAEEITFDGELYAIYLLAEHRRGGLGRLLTERVARYLLDRGFHNMLVWVLEANPSRKFYEALGGQYITTKTATLAAGVYEEVAYGWPDLPALVSQLESRRETDAV